MLATDRKKPCIFIVIVILLYFNICSAEDLVSYPHGAPKIISDFGSWYNTIGEKRKEVHEAIDIIEEPGYPIIAAAPGEVVRADDKGEWGYRIVVYHGKNDFGNPVSTVYLHNQKNLVKKGNRVKRGQQIAELGKCPSCKTAHLHFAVVTGPRGRLKYESPHQYWVDGPNKITCFDAKREYKNDLLFTYPVSCSK